MRLSALLSAALLLGAGGVAVPAEENQALSLSTVQSLRAAEVDATGRVVPLFSARIGCRVSGHITEWGRDEAGQPLDVGMSVTAGQTLFVVNPSTFKTHTAAAEAALAYAQATAAEFEARLQDRVKDQERFERLVNVDQTVALKRLEEVQLAVASLKQQWAAGQARVKEARAALDAAQLDLHDSVVQAPFDGVITQRLKGLGDYVSGAPLVEVLELTTVDRLEAELRLPEAYLPLVVPGKTRVMLGSPILKNELDLPVTRVVPVVESTHGTFVFRVAIPPEQRNGLVPGLFLTGRLLLAGATEEVLVPLRALLSAGDQPAVMVAVEGKMVRRAVTLGSRLTEGVVIRSGLRAGEKVVIGPAEMLKDGAPLPEALKTPDRK